MLSLLYNAIIVASLACMWLLALQHRSSDISAVVLYYTFTEFACLFLWLVGPLRTKWIEALASFNRFTMRFSAGWVVFCWMVIATVSERALNATYLFVGLCAGTVAVREGALLLRSFRRSGHKVA